MRTREEIAAEVAKVQELRQQHVDYLGRLATYLKENHVNNANSIINFVEGINRDWVDRRETIHDQVYMDYSSVGRYTYSAQEDDITRLERLLNAAELHLTYYEEDGRRRGVRIKEVE